MVAPVRPDAAAVISPVARRGQVAVEKVVFQALEQQGRHHQHSWHSWHQPDQRHGRLRLPAKRCGREPQQADRGPRGRKIAGTATSPVRRNPGPTSASASVWSHGRQPRRVCLPGCAPPAAPMTRSGRKIWAREGRDSAVIADQTHRRCDHDLADPGLGPGGAVSAAHGHGGAGDSDPLSGKDQVRVGADDRPVRVVDRPVTVGVEPPGNRGQVVTGFHHVHD